MVKSQYWMVLGPTNSSDKRILRSVAAVVEYK